MSKSQQCTLVKSKMSFKTYVDCRRDIWMVHLGRKFFQVQINRPDFFFGVAHRILNYYFLGNTKHKRKSTQLLKRQNFGGHVASFSKQLNQATYWAGAQTGSSLLRKTRVYITFLTPIITQPEYICTAQGCC